jgi:hypothetical protein
MLKVSPFIWIPQLSGISGGGSSAALAEEANTPQENAATTRYFFAFMPPFYQNQMRAARCPRAFFTKNYTAF